MRKVFSILLVVSTVTVLWALLSAVIVYKLSGTVDVPTFLARMLIVLNDWILEYIFIIFSVLTTAFSTSSASEIEDTYPSSNISIVGSGTRWALLEEGRRSSMDGSTATAVAPYPDSIH